MDGNDHNYPYGMPPNDIYTNDPSNYYGSSYPPPANNNQPPDFEVSQFSEQGDWMEDDPTLMGSVGYDYQQSPNRQDEVSNIDGSSSQHEYTVKSRKGKEKKEIREKVAFKKNSEVGILDDGFKWRKYGKKMVKKKMVKNSPNPRNYYRCAFEGCPAKKRVEWDKEDAKFVITTYEGIHNHEGPSHPALSSNFNF